jgi:gas vesicle protein
MKTFVNFVSGFVVGALAGDAIALLFAPASGDDLRDQIQSQAQRVQSEVKEAAELRRAELEEQLERMRSPK